MNILTTSKFDNFLNYEDNDLYKSFFTTLFYTGLRKGEALCLTVNDVDFDSNVIRIRKAYNPRNKEITSPKTKKANRDILMVDKVSNCLKRLIPDENGFLFGFNKVTATTLSRKCKNNCKKANINKNIRIHDFRHSFASLCIANNIPIQIISNYMGHENISTTLDIYGHLYPNSQQQLICALNSFLTKQDQKQDQKK